jgi:ribulose-5-phosphate 4-epimerase/fuculose-1-phosphate aldolase
VSAEDLMEYDLDTNPIDQRGRPMYFEKPIHGAIYQARPDLMAVIHNHAYEVIPYGLAKVKLGAVIHPACGIGTEVPIWDIRDKFGDTNMLVTTMEQGKDLARVLGRNGAALMAGHGCVVGATSLREAVLTAIYLKVNAAIQSEASRLGTVRFLSAGELAMTAAVTHSENSLNRAWQYWTRRCDHTH